MSGHLWVKHVQDSEQMEAHVLMYLCTALNLVLLQTARSKSAGTSQIKILNTNGTLMTKEGTRIYFHKS